MALKTGKKCKLLLTIPEDNVVLHGKALGFDIDQSVKNVSKRDSYYICLNHSKKLYKEMKLRETFMKQDNEIYLLYNIIKCNDDIFKNARQGRWDDTISNNNSNSNQKTNVTPTLKRSLFSSFLG
mmetsp:Transcript_77221/g.94696  ORF Transcript_77221/g.94696 Transcript_77221/m.94696 type:complete len:125 (+) Transcript_77221:72-446(+)